VFAPEEPIAGGALLEVADLNADGWSDLVIGRADTIEVRLGDGAGQFAGPTLELSGSFLAVADFTGDHRLDLAVILPNGHPGVRAGDGLGGFASPVDWGPSLFDGQLPSQMAYKAVDLDGDGRSDLAAVRPAGDLDGNDSLCVSWNEGGAFSGTRTFDAGPLHTELSHYTYTFPMDLACGDFDGDGLLDVAVVKGDGEAGVDGFLTTIHNMGHRGFGAPQALLDASEDPLTTAVADFDGDGRADLALADVMTDFTGRFLVFKGQDDGSLLETPGPSGLGGYAVHHWAFSIAAGDFNGDGRSDVAVGCGIPTFREGSTVIVVPNVTPLLGATPTLASLVSVEARPDQVSLEWNVGGSGATAATVERRTPSTNWTSLERLHPDGQGRLGFEDRAVDAGARYGYRLALEGATSAQSTTTETWVDVPRSVAFAISGASPNPTRGPLFVRMTLPTGDPVRLELLDVTGRRVRERTIAAPTAGAQSFALSDRAPLDPGVYFVRATQGPRSVSARVAVVR
jgi:FG-GAP-like repeat